MTGAETIQDVIDIVEEETGEELNEGETREQKIQALRDFAEADEGNENEYAIGLALMAVLNRQMQERYGEGESVAMAEVQHQLKNILGRDVGIIEDFLEEAFLWSLRTSSERAVIRKAADEEAPLLLTSFQSLRSQLGDGWEIIHDPETLGEDFILIKKGKWQVGYDGAEYFMQQAGENDTRITFTNFEELQKNVLSLKYVFDAPEASESLEANPLLKSFQNLQGELGDGWEIIHDPETLGEDFILIKKGKWQVGYDGATYFMQDLNDVENTKSEFDSFRELRNFLDLMKDVFEEYPVARETRENPSLRDVVDKNAALFQYWDFRPGATEATIKNYDGRTIQVIQAEEGYILQFPLLESDGKTISKRTYTKTIQNEATLISTLKVYGFSPRRQTHWMMLREK